MPLNWQPAIISRTPIKRMAQDMLQRWYHGIIDATL